MSTFCRLINNNNKCKSKNVDAFQSVITDETECDGRIEKLKINDFTFVFLFQNCQY
jgi:hypothetical protein